MGVDGLKMLWDRGQRTYNLMCVDSSFYPNKLPCAKRFPFPSAFATNDVVATRRNQTVTKQLIGGILEARNLSDAAGWPRNLTTICNQSDAFSTRRVFCLANLGSSTVRRHV